MGPGGVNAPNGLAQDVELADRSRTVRYARLINVLMVSSSSPNLRLHSILTTVYVRRVKDLESDKSNLASALDQEIAGKVALKKELDMLRNVLRERC